MNRDEVFQGDVLIAVPHSDDEMLGCGAAIAQAVDKSRIHFVYVSDSSGSPDVPAGVESVAQELALLRRAEAETALAIAGVPLKNATFLGLPDGQLNRHLEEIDSILLELCATIQPQTILAPFRFDSHPDHLAVNRVVAGLVATGRVKAQLLEYFIYFRLRLLPRGDLRAYIRPDYLITVDSPDCLKLKRSYLRAYRSQCEKIYTWQTRPVIGQQLLNQLVETPEYFCRGANAKPDRELFLVHPWMIRWAHALEFRLKHLKEWLNTNLRQRFKFRYD